MKFNRNQMLFLINKIKDGFEATHKGNIPKKSNQYYGYGKYDSQKPSIRGFMEQMPSIKSHLDSLNKEKKPNQTGFKSINGKRLYEAEQNAKKLRQFEFELDDFYAAIYLYAAGFSSEEDMVEGYKKEIPSTIYDGYYFSYKDYIIKEFVLSIDFSSEPFLATEWGLHDDKSNPRYIGTATLVGQHLYIDLQRKDGTDKLKLIAHVGKVHPSERRVTPCVFLGISVHAGNIIHAEAVLIQRDLKDSKEMTTDRQNKLNQYLMLKRNNHRLSYYGYSSLKELTVRNVPVSRIEHMVGALRAWSMDSKGNIVQSKFVIEENYRSFLFSALYHENEAKQVCLLNISQAINRRLCISTHPDQGTGTITYCILDIPPKRYKFIRGVYCHVGLENLPSRAGYVILTKEDEEFEPQVIERNEFDKYVQGNGKLIEMRKKLIEWKSSSANDLMK